MSKVPYKDNQFYEDAHGWEADRRAGKHRDWWEHDYDSAYVGREKVEGYSFKQYLNNYQQAEREQVLLDGQAPMMDDQEFSQTKKKLFDLFTIPEQTDRITQRMATLVNRLCLNPYQQYRYEDYWSRHKVAKEAKKTTDPQLSLEEFIRLKRELVGLLTKKQRGAMKPGAAMFLERAQKLRLQLFPPIPIDW